MRLIDADALLAAYDAQHEGAPGKARKLIENAPTVGGWISVKDRLPEKYGFYLCLTMSDDIKLHYQINLWGLNHWFWACHDVRYWMPLPEPPKEGT